jgi:hypothetical protein
MQQMWSSNWRCCGGAKTRLCLALSLGAILLMVAACSHKGKSGESATAPSPSQTPQQSAGETAGGAAGASAPAPDKPQPVAAEMHNVLFHFSDAAAAHVETLTGELLATGNNPMPVMDDKSSFVVRIKSAHISVSPLALAQVLNTFVFAKPDSPVRDISISIKDQQLHLKGKLHSKGDLPFETVGTPSTTPDGRIRIHSEKVKAFHLPVKGMMNLFGIELASLLGGKIPGIEADKDDLLLDLSKLLPPPHLQGAVTEVHLESDQIVMTIGNGERSAPLEKGNYMAFRGGKIRVGKLVMNDSDLMVLDLDPADPLDWNQDRYREQLVAGYSKTTPTFGLRAYVKDYGKLSRVPKGGVNPAGE